MRLEEAGFSYDSTVGYNETVGYRAGTTQVYKPLETANLLELPLHVMDTALFYPCHRNLSPQEAGNVVGGLVENTGRFGGVLTINWHDRSIVPERLWDECYVRLLAQLRQREAWFATGAQAVAWFRKRRSAALESVLWDGDTVHVKASMKPEKGGLPGLRIRVHRPRSKAAPGTPRAESADAYVDVAFDQDVDLCLALGAGALGRREEAEAKWAPGSQATAGEGRDPISL